MCESAMMSKSESWPLDAAQHVQIGGLGSKRQGERGQSRLAIESGAAEACAG